MGPLLAGLVLACIQECPVALYQRAELREGGFADREMRKLLGPRQAASDSTGLTHVLSASHRLTPTSFHLHCDGRPDGECLRGVL